MSETNDPAPRTARLLEAGVVAGLAFLAVAPYVHYLTRVAFGDATRRFVAPVPLTRVLEADLLLLGVLVTACALAGSLFSDRHGLSGRGDLARLRASLRYVLPAGVVLAGATYLLFGRHLAARVPGTYPASVGWAALLLIKGAVFDETVARYGVMTLFNAVVRRPWIANLLQAALFTWLTSRNLAFHGVTLPWGFLLAASLASSLVVHLGHGLAFARFGLATSVTMHAVTDLKYVAHALLARP
jgi:hypothetical protein